MGMWFGLVHLAEAELGGYAVDCPAAQEHTTISGFAVCAQMDWRVSVSHAKGEVEKG